MLTQYGQSYRLCGGINRRSFLKVGTLGLGGRGLPELFCLCALAGSGVSVPAKSSIILFLPGGPTHIDTYDRKPDALTVSGEQR